MKIHRWLGAIFILAVVILGLGFIKFGQIQAAIAFAESFPEPSAAVKTDIAKATSYTKMTKVIGQVRATQSLVVSNEYPGSITYVGFAPGDVVKKDQVLLRINDSVEQADLAAAKAQLVLAKKSYKRMAKLLENDRISQDEVDRAQAQVQITKAQVDNLSSIIDKKRITAPFDGKVDLSNYQVGQFLDANSQITSLIGIEKEIWIDFSIPQTLPQLAIGEQVSVALTSAGKQAQTQLAKVIAKHSSVDAASRQQGYRAIIDNQDGQFIHNQMINVYIPIIAQNAVLVPSNAITRSHFGEFVYQLEKDETGNFRAKPIKVTLGDKIHDKQVVVSGLFGGEFIATEGAFKLYEGILVYPDMAGGGAPSATAVGGH